MIYKNVMKWFSLSVTLMVWTHALAGQSGKEHVELQITSSEIVFNHQVLPDDRALQSALLELAKQDPKPVIYLTGEPGVSIERMTHLVGILMKSGLKIYIIGHEVPSR